MKYLTSREAAARLGVHQTTVSRLVADGEIVPAMKGPGLTGAFFFLPADVDRLADKRGCDSGSVAS